MDGAVREKSLLEEIDALEIEDHVKDRLRKKYWKEANERRDYIEKLRCELHQEAKDIKKACEEKEVIISVLASHIKEKELL